MCLNSPQLNTEKWAHLVTVTLKIEKIKPEILVWLGDPAPSVTSHVEAITNSAYYHLKSIARMKGSLSEKGTENLSLTLIFSSLGYRSVVFTGLGKESTSPGCCCQNPHQHKESAAHHTSPAVNNKLHM